MELPKNITQIGETNPHCKVYVEDYVISYIKQLNQYASEKEMAVALYGVRKEEAGITYLFLYGACKLVFLQKECRHLSQAVLQEAEKQRKRFFPDTVFLGYRLLDGEMIEGFHICEQSVCRYVEGYAQFYEKNDAMLAFMLEERQEASKPEIVDQEKYNMVKKRQEERRALAQEKSGQAMLSKRKISRLQESVPEAEGTNPDANTRAGTGINAGANGKIRGMKLTVAAVFALLCVTGLAAMGDGERLDEWQMAIRQLMENMSQQQLPDAVQVSNGTAQVGTIVAEDRLNDAILNENAAADPALTESEEGQASVSGVSGAEEGEQAEQQPGQGSVQGQDQVSGQGASRHPEQQNGENGQQPGEDSDSQQVPQATQPPAQDSDGQTAQDSDGAPAQDSDGSPAQDSDGQTAQDSDEQPVQDAQAEEAKPAAGPTAELVSYIVQKGDTLIGICVKRYGSDARVSEICSLNNIENPDDIKVGEKIFLPQ